MTKHKKDKKDHDMKTKEKKKDVVELSVEDHEKLVKSAGELEELRARFLRSAADFENAKKRLVKEREDFFKYALEGMVLDLLPVVDNFERAIAHTDETNETIKPIREGFLLIQKQFASLLSERGLKRLETVGKMFDPHQHESIGEVASDKEEGTILDEALAGYELNGKLIRPAKVRVAAAKEAEKASPSGEEDNENSEEGVS